MLRQGVFFSFVCEFIIGQTAASLYYIAYVACKNYGYDGLAEKVAETYIKLLDESFETTGNLWEKYDGLTGKVANADYNAPKMMGRTAGVYMYSCAEL